MSRDLRIAVACRVRPWDGVSVAEHRTGGAYIHLPTCFGAALVVPGAAVGEGKEETTVTWRCRRCPPWRERSGDCRPCIESFMFSLVCQGAFGLVFTQSPSPDSPAGSMSGGAALATGLHASHEPGAPPSVGGLAGWRVWPPCGQTRQPAKPPTEGGAPGSCEA